VASFFQLLRGAQVGIFNKDGSLNWARIQALAMAGAILYGIYRFGPNQPVKAMALGAGGAIIAKNLPFVKEVA
jgi:hypothetical protein